MHLPAPPSPGDVVTFAYDNYAKRDVPANAEIVRVRHDVSWEYIVLNAAREDAMIGIYIHFLFIFLNIIVLNQPSDLKN